MKRQGGFTLIEMIVVIVILGILAVTAAPRFINFQDDAREAALDGLVGALNSAAQMDHGRFLIDGDETNRVNGYPEATAAGIGSLVVLNGFEPNPNQSASPIQYRLVDNGGDDCVQYTDAEVNAFPAIAVVACTATP